MTLETAGTSHPVRVGVDDVCELGARSEARLDGLGQPGVRRKLQGAGDKPP